MPLQTTKINFNKTYSPFLRSMVLNFKSIQIIGIKYSLIRAKGEAHSPLLSTHPVMRIEVKKYSLLSVI